jgi:sigma-B regulation protein RsbU (phosphoserine phosphatase)
MPKGGGVSQLMAPNFVIGAFPSVSYCGQTVAIQPPSTLYVFSDGVYEVERPDGTMWSLAELEKYLTRPPKAAGSEIDSLYKTLQKMRGSEILDDDFSMLKVRLGE